MYKYLTMTTVFLSVPALTSVQPFYIDFVALITHYYIESEHRCNFSSRFCPQGSWPLLVERTRVYFMPLQS